ncbi:MAG TPA: SCO family protein [Gemmataceae bacterium]|jgi:protein SCO1/2|nr:SCO family protein [Gemmataceae bacterium]
MLALSLLTAALSAGADASRLAVIRRAPDFALTDQDGRTVRSADLRGKVVVVSFVFTTCNGTCPATTHRMSDLAQALKEQGLFKGDAVRLLSVTLDPARDTPEALRRYMRLYDAGAAHWGFLTGPREQVEKVIAAWGMWARPAAGGQLDHPSRVFLIDPRWRVREIYSLEYFKPAWVLDDVRLLLKEAGRGK